MLRYCLILLFASLCPAAWAQEFPAGFSLPIELAQGFNQPAGNPPRYLLTLQAVPQVTLVPGRLRLGAVVGGFYPGERVGALIGPRLTLRLIQGNPLFLASSFNVHLLGEFLWGTAPQPAGNRRLLGGGLGLGSSDLVTAFVKLHRDLSQRAMWFELGLSYNLTKRRIPPL